MPLVVPLRARVARLFCSAALFVGVSACAVDPEPSATARGTDAEQEPMTPSLEEPEQPQQPEQPEEPAAPADPQELDELEHEDDEAPPVFPSVDDGGVPSEAADAGPVPSSDAGPPDAPAEPIVVELLGMDSSAPTCTLVFEGEASLDDGEDADGALDEDALTVTLADPLDVDTVHVIGVLVDVTCDGPARVTVDGEIVLGAPELRSGAPFDDAPTIRVTVRSSVALLARNGRVSERMVALYAARAFEEAGYNFEVVSFLPAESPPDEAAVCGGGEAFSWWQSRVNSDDATLVRRKDANLLILDAAGGGCGAVGGWVGTSAGRHIDEERPWAAMGSDTWHRNVHGNLHELGHQLGMRHDHEPDVPGAQHRGAGWNEGGFWHRTPSVAGSGAPNHCGDDIEQKNATAIMRHQTYSPCAAAAFVVRPE